MGSACLRRLVYARTRMSGGAGPVETGQRNTRPRAQLVWGLGQEEPDVLRGGMERRPAWLGAVVGKGTVGRTRLGS